ncbi:MAG TPA: maleylpyruvate isomerase family mycothiol-dependent enzyme [Pseudonocardiaceae bacterium]|nr:maleylpyruvate isomerase family mycothiol-dependent enzyme [Pseudonocardiaceae bacterium]
MPALRSEPLQQQSERFERSDAAFARDGLVAVRRASAALHEIVGTMDEATMHGPSRLDGWTRGHVVSHLARNADGLVNLLSWARTGIEHPMYASAVDREADIEEGAHRLARVQQEDLWAAHQRFGQAADGLSAADWSTPVTDRMGRPLVASLVPWMRLTEVLVHQVDLDLGADFDRVAELVGPQAEPFIEYVVTRYENRTDVPAVRLSVELPGGDERIWTLGSSDEDASDVHGSVAATAAWLTGREVPAGLVGDVPRLPAWL